MGHFHPSDKLLLHGGSYPRRCKDGWCLADSKRRGKARRWTNKAREEESRMMQPYKIMVIEDDQ